MTISSHDKELIRLRALELGFTACGFAVAAPVETSAVEQYENWLAQGHNDCMDYAANHMALRFNPVELVPGAKTVISVALNYFPAQKQRVDAPQFSMYAYGKDYHEVVRDKLRLLAQFINEKWQAESRVCVDTAPVMEKYWARQAGIGMTGRNNLLIIPGKGSYFFLGELITNLEIAPDAACNESCGDCMRCVEACPGGALSGDSLDARKCLSCQLIERRGELPQWVQEKVGNRVYGCDACQLCCPHNAKAVPCEVEEFAPSAEFLSLTLDDISSMTEERFARLFRHSAVKRTKLAGLLRNAQMIIKK